MTGLQLKIEGQQLALWSETAEFRDALTEAIGRAGAGGKPFTSDDVQRILPGLFTGPYHPNSVGGGMAAAAKTGLIEQTGEYRRTERKSGHARIVSVWRIRTL